MKERWEILAELINNNGFTHIAEIGVSRGINAANILRLCPKIKKFYLVDIDFSVLDMGLFENYKDKIYITRENRVADINRIDLAFIDAEHTYEAVQRDIRTWLPKINHNGIICGHDYLKDLDQPGYGVNKAVHEAFSFVNLEQTNEESGKIYIWWLKISQPMSSSQNSNQVNYCNKIINDKYRYANRYKHFIDYGGWFNQTANNPHPVMPLTMLDSMDFSGEEFFYNCKNILKKYNVTGKMLEIGSRHEGPWQDEEKFWELEYHNLNLEKTHNSERTVIGDITNCPQIPDASYDFVYSMDTFEHITEPWKAAKEICRILKPGGVVFIVTLFSWRYHPDPIDYWRYTPHCLAFLFKQLECIEANWDIRNRRIPHQGHEGDNDICPEDHFGPWLEGWRVYYIGIKK